jgi:YD repeat-containing protein
VVNKTYTDAIQQSGINLNLINSPVDDAGLRIELDKLRALPGALVSTYTYAPLIGMTSETGPNGQTVYYEYDALLRPKAIRDRQGNLVKAFTYKYLQQP